MRPLARPVSALLIALVGLPALAEPGIEVMRGMASCEGSLFSALAKDSARWRGEPSFTRKQQIASFKVTDRAPPEYQGRSADAIVEFKKAREIGGLHLLSFHDSDLTNWSVFRRNGVRFTGWGFYIYEMPEDVVTWYKLHAPERAQHLARSTADKPDVFCIEEILVQNEWKRVRCTADDGFPSSREPRRWFVIRADSSDLTRSVVSCEYSGDVPASLMRRYRPDLGAVQK